MGLVSWSEQTTELLHEKLKQCLENYLVRDTEHRLYNTLFTIKSSEEVQQRLGFILNLILMIFMLNYTFRFFYLFTL